MPLILSSVLENQVNLCYQKVGCPFWTCQMLPLNSKIGPGGSSPESFITTFFFKIANEWPEQPGTAASVATSYWNLKLPLTKGQNLRLSQNLVFLS